MNNLKLSDLSAFSDAIGFSLETVHLVKSNMNKFFHYKRFCKGEKTRTLAVPHGDLKKIQKAINKKLFQKAVLPAVIKGGRKRISLYDNAKVHCNSRTVATLDIKNFYPSISSNRVRSVLVSLGCAESVADVVVMLTTCNGRVPLGFSTSPSLANLVLHSMAHRFESLAKKQGLICTFWVDDITFSGDFKLDKFENLFRKIVQQEGFSVNETKQIKFMHDSERQVVTKLVVNSETPKVSREYRRHLRSLIHRCIFYGPETQTDGSLVKFCRSLRGKVNYVKSIDEVQGKKIEKQFDKIKWN